MQEKSIPQLMHKIFITLFHSNVTILFELYIYIYIYIYIYNIYIYYQNDHLFKIIKLIESSLSLFILNFSIVQFVGSNQNTTEKYKNRL
jgi:hypothetical protein